MTDFLATLIEEFSHFPGVGPRQARRFAYYLLTRDENKLKQLTTTLLAAKKSITHCTSCTRLFIRKEKETLCTICSDISRDKSLLMIVGHDVDIESVEKSGVYRGQYFVLGGNIPILEENPEEHIRVTELKRAIQKRETDGLKEIILALDVNPEGEHTMHYLASLLAPLVSPKSITLSLLGRGLSTGTELQYSDPETIKNALSGRLKTE